jgi:flagellar basal body-associated protein FliL
MKKKENHNRNAIVILVLAVIVIFAIVATVAFCWPDQWPTKPEPRPLITG